MNKIIFYCTMMFSVIFMSVMSSCDSDNDSESDKVESTNPYRETENKLFGSWNLTSRVSNYGTVDLSKYEKKLTFKTDMTFQMDIDDCTLYDHNMYAIKGKWYVKIPSEKNSNYKVVMNNGRIVYENTITFDNNNNRLIMEDDSGDSYVREIYEKIIK